jgi:ATP-dependent DNA ligase
VRLVTRNGNDFTARFPQIATAVAALPLRSCVIDGEAIFTDSSGGGPYHASRVWLVSRVSSQSTEPVLTQSAAAV